MLLEEIVVVSSKMNRKKESTKRRNLLDTSLKDPASLAFGFDSTLAGTMVRIELDSQRRIVEQVAVTARLLDVR